MSDVLRSPLNKTQFDYIKRCKRLAEKGSLYEKLEYLEEEAFEIDKPLQQLIKACQALEVVDTTQDTFKNDPSVKSCIETLDEYVKGFKEILDI